MNKKWFEQPNIVSLVVLWKYILGFSYSEIIVKLRELGIITSKSSLDSKFRDWGLLAEIDSGILQSRFSEEELAAELDKILKFKIKSSPPSKNKGDIEQILVTSDYHSPFYRKDMVEYLINTYSKKINKLLIAGDFFDHYSISRYIPYNLEIDLADEFRISTALMQQLCNAFPEVEIISGNHDDRIYKHFINRIGKEYMFLVNYDWIKFMTTKFSNLKRVSNIVGNENEGQHTIGHYAILGKDCLVGHFEVSGTKTTILKGSQKVEDWANTWRVYLPELNYCKLVLQAHTHHIGKAAIYGGAKVLGETGCMCQVQEYSVKPDAKYTPGTPGYWIVNQENGETNINESNFFIF